MRLILQLQSLYWRIVAHSRLIERDNASKLNRQARKYAVEWQREVEATDRLRKVTSARYRAAQDELKRISDVLDKRETLERFGAL